MPTDPNTPKDDQRRADGAKLVSAIQEMEARFPATIELIQYQARVARIKYLALVEQGFTSSEAAALCLQQWS